MAVLSTIASKSSGCDGGAVNTGQLGCKVGFGYAVHAIGLKKGTVIPKTQDLDQAYMNGLVQSGIAIPLIGAFSSEVAVADDQNETSPLGIEALTLLGLHKYSFTFKEGESFYKELAKLRGYGNLDFILGDTNGNWLVALNSNGDYKGFSAGQVTIIDVPATATETRKRTLSFQLIDRTETDNDYDMFLSSLLFPISDVLGINGVQLSFADANGAVIPANADTTLKVRATLNDGVTGVLGLGVTDFSYSKAGATVVPTGITEQGNGYYTLTVPVLSTGEALNIQNYDGTANKNVIILQGVLYRSNVLTATVV